MKDSEFMELLLRVNLFLMKSIAVKYNDSIFIYVSAYRFHLPCPDPMPLKSSWPLRSSGQPLLLQVGRAKISSYMQICVHAYLHPSWKRNFPFQFHPIRTDCLCSLLHSRMLWSVISGYVLLSRAQISTNILIAIC